MNVSILEHDTCTGCSACFASCKYNSIEMIADDEGFIRPQIKDSCTDCGACAKACPILNPVLLKNADESYAIQCSDAYRPYGSSGGVFGAIATHILEQGGVVYGAAFRDDYTKLIVKRATSIEELKPLLKSKYVQADVGSAYNDIKKDLESGRVVLYCGCPCQIAGLRSFLKKDYDTLYLIDFLCHGAVSPLVYNRFLSDVSGGKKVVNVDFRDKKYGWGTLIKVTFADGSEHYDHYNGNYFESFLNGYSMRKSCYRCPYSSDTRVSDLTIGDFWGVSEINPKYDDKKGTSLVLTINDKGKYLISSIKADPKLFVKVPVEETISLSKRTNGAISAPTRCPSTRDCFMNHIRSGYSVQKSMAYAKSSLIDVGILGWWIDTPKSNYGSTLTCFSLYRYLQSLGLSVAFISLANFDRNNAGHFNKEQHYRMTMKYSYSEMSNNDRFIDTYIVGSDVLWYYGAFKESGYQFFLDFVGESKRKISYSTSFGNTNQFIPDIEIPLVRSLLKRFDSVSVRETEAVDICKNIFDIDAKLVLDPVFLNDLLLWEDLAKSSDMDINKKYIFVYFLDPTLEKIENVNKLAEERGLEIISVTDKQFNTDKKVELLKECNVKTGIRIEDFVKLLLHSEYVVTDSYHGMCFSILFNKKHTVIVNTARGSSRFESLANLLQIKNELIYDPNDLLSTSHIGVEYSRERLNKAIEDSRNWLKNALLFKDNKVYSTTDLLCQMMVKLKTNQEQK